MRSFGFTVAPLARAGAPAADLVPDSEARPRLLAITSQLPWPLDRGGHLRTFHLLRALATRFRVKLIAGVAADGPPEGIEALGRAGISVRPAVLAPRRSLGEAVRALGAALRAEPYVLYRRHARRAVAAAVEDELVRDPPRVLYLDHLDSMLFRPARGAPPVVVDLHNVYSALCRRAAAEERRAALRPWLFREALLLERMERRAACRSDGVLAVSEGDAARIEALGARRVSVVPNGVSCSTYADLPCAGRTGGPLLLYVGAMSWPPNAAAARHLATDVLPKVRAVHPGARLRIVGADPPPEVAALARAGGVEVAGRVPDVRPHLAAAHALTVPLEAGGGTRLKIIEAFAAGLPVVSTPVGCEGLEVADGEHLVVAPRERFAAAVISLLGDPARAARLAERARSLARERYDWAAVGARACAAVERLLASRPAAASPAAERR